MAPIRKIPSGAQLRAKCFRCENQNECFECKLRQKFNKQSRELHQTFVDLVHEARLNPTDARYQYEHITDYDGVPRPLFWFDDERHLKQQADLKRKFEIMVEFGYTEDEFNALFKRTPKIAQRERQMDGLEKKFREFYAMSQARVDSELNFIRRHGIGISENWTRLERGVNEHIKIVENNDGKLDVEDNDPDVCNLSDALQRETCEADDA